jgi:membrane protease YdiL (CAAX protease family)
MWKYVRQLSGRAEFIIVVVGAFGLVLPSSVWHLFVPPSVSGERAQITTAGLQQLIVYEVLVCAVLGSFLRARGWTFERIGLKPGVRDSVIGLGFVVVTYLFDIIAWNVVVHLAPGVARAAAASSVTGTSLDFFTVLVASAINGTFEEVFVCAYIISALKSSRGIATAVNVSAGLRVTYHFYQGAYGVLTIAPMALLFAYWYVRTGRLWPLIIAHIVVDVIGLISLS